MEDSDIRRELDQLHQADRDLRQALNDLDSHGSRGVLQLSAQVLDLIKDFGDLKATFVSHEKRHEDEQRDRRNGRRWFIATALTGLGAFGGIIYTLFEILSKLH